MIGTESWLDSTLTDNDIFPSNYSVYHKDRNSRGGGVFVMVHSSLNWGRIEVESVSCETAWCKITLANGTSIVFGSFYGPPASNTQCIFDLNNILLSLDATYTVVEGDFNLTNIDWLCHQPKITTSLPI